MSMSAYFIFCLPISYFVYVSNNHCHRVTTQLQLINIIIIIIIIITNKALGRVMQVHNKALGRVMQVQTKH